MADELTPEHPADDEVAIGGRLFALLAEPEIWAEPDPDAEASIVAAIAAAAAAERPDLARELDVVVKTPSSGVVVLRGSTR